MDKRTEILQELESTAPHLVSLNKAGTFSVPDNYFDGLAEAVLSKIKTLPTPSTDDLETIAPTLNSIGKQNVYAAPSNYFDTFHVNIPVAEKHPAKIIGFKRLNIFVKYAVAAAFAGIVFTSAFLFIRHHNNQRLLPENVANTMKGMSDDELNEYADEHNIQVNYDSLAEDDTELNIASELKIVSSEELEQYYKNEHMKSATTTLDN